MKTHFENFINNQPADMAINHEWGWGSCAVGEYANSINMPLIKVVGELYLAYGTNRDNNIIARIYGTTSIPLTENETLMDLLNLNKFETYGELNNYIQQLAKLNGL